MAEKPTLYVETTIPSYLVSRPRRDAHASMYQTITCEWWDNHREEYWLGTSELVYRECVAGDPTFAKLRCETLEGIPRVAETPESMVLAGELIRAMSLPARALADALHISLAAMNRFELLLTWNCKHLANPRKWRTIADVCRRYGFRSPVICTSATLLENSDV